MTTIEDQRPRIIVPAISGSTPVFMPEYACTVICCEGTTCNDRHRYCAQHVDDCMKVADSKVAFGCHATSLWSDVIRNERKYVNFILYKTDRYDTKPGDIYHERNRIVRGYIENEQRAFFFKK